MSIIENNVVVKVNVRVKAKAFSQKDKKTMYSIMGFLLNLKEQGILDDEKVMSCLETLPLYKTAAEKTAFFQQDMFDTKKVEEELYKPMVSDYKKAKKEKKQVAKKVAVEKKPKKVLVEGEEKKPSAKKVVAVEGEEKKPSAKKGGAVEGEEKKPRAKKVAVEGKRGRKPKEQIVELAQEQEHDDDEHAEESLDILIQSMNQREEEKSVVLEEIQVEDVDDILRELEAEEIIEPTTTTPVIKKKEGKKSSSSSEEKQKQPVKKTKKNKE